MPLLDGEIDMHDDKHPCHTARSVTSWLVSAAVWVLPWLRNVPDLMSAAVWVLPWLHNVPDLVSATVWVLPWLRNVPDLVSATVWFLSWPRNVPDLNHNGEHVAAH